MSKEHRFYYVTSRKGNVCHVYKGKTLVEGGLLECGRRMKKGWYWYVERLRGGMRRCKGCDK